MKCFLNKKERISPPAIEQKLTTMSTIQQIIETNNALLLSAIEKEMQERLSLLKNELIIQLAEKYDFDPDEAMKLPAAALPIFDSKIIKKKKKTKKKKDPNAPVGPKNMFIHFSQAKRKELQNSSPDMKTTDITKQLGTMWKLLDEEQRKPYKDAAAMDKKRYADAMLLYSEPEH